MILKRKCKLIAGFFLVNLVLFLVPTEQGFAEIWTKDVTPTCKFEYGNEDSSQECYKLNIERLDNCLTSPFAFNISAVKESLGSNVNFHDQNFTTIWKSKVQPQFMPQDRYDNVGEPSIASNGTHVFYTGNHYAAKSKIGDNWSFVDPRFDFKGMLQPGAPGNETSSNNTSIDLYKADQRTIYDDTNNMYIWIRLGDTYAEGEITNIIRISVSNDTKNWTVLDIIPVNTFQEQINEGFFDYPDVSFDYPEVTVTDENLFVTATLVLGYNCQKAYGAIFRIPLDDLGQTISNPNLPISFDTIVDRNVTGISPVEGTFNNSAYFGAHFKNNSLLRLYEWNEDANHVDNRTISIEPWNNIHLLEACGEDPSQSEKWWCKANTSSRIRSAWVYNDTLNFMWNAITTPDYGKTWKPYIEVATFDLRNNMSIERQYHVTDQYRPWIFGAAVPSKNQTLGFIGYYVTSDSKDPNISPYLNLAFGYFNDTTNKWEMMSIVNSSSSLPVRNETMSQDYNFGDFLTIRKHVPSIEDYRWDAGGYVIVGEDYTDVEPYFFMIK
jgi:hypothetical protein